MISIQKTIHNHVGKTALLFLVTVATRFECFFAAYAVKDEPQPTLHQYAWVSTARLHKRYALFKEMLNILKSLWELKRQSTFYGL